MESPLKASDGAGVFVICFAIESRGNATSCATGTARREIVTVMAYCVCNFRS